MGSWVYSTDSHNYTIFGLRQFYLKDTYSLRKGRLYLYTDHSPRGDRFSVKVHKLCTIVHTAVSSRRGTTDSHTQRVG